MLRSYLPALLSILLLREVAVDLIRGASYEDGVGSSLSAGNFSFRWLPLLFCKLPAALLAGFPLRDISINPIGGISHEDGVGSSLGPGNFSHDDSFFRLTTVKLPEKLTMCRR